MKIKSEATNHQVLVGLGLPGDNDPQNSNSFVLQLRDNTVQVFTETGLGANHQNAIAPAPPLGEWAELTFVFDEGWVRYYREGVLVAAEPYVVAETQAQSLMLAGWYIEGGNDDDAEVFVGLMDDFVVFDEPLTAAQVAILTAP